MQTMIDNYSQIFGRDDMIGDYFEIKTYDLKMYEESINSHDKSPFMIEVIANLDGETCDNDAKLNTSDAALQEEGTMSKTRFIYSSKEWKDNIIL